MDKAALEQLTAQLKEQQAAAAEAVALLRGRLTPGAVAEAARTKLAEAAKAATVRPDGRPKQWVLAAVSTLLVLVVTGVAVRLARRAK
ncbi:MAG: hypothetical protein LBD97_03610 [Bifidobacteriaceae bacterium]|jgi:hypothetical protein|nr:hypothetical protein [Bifidobacteriaceae bacterium]